MTRMLIAALVASLVITLGLFAWTRILSGQLSSLRIELVAAKAEVDQARQAVQVQREHLKRLETERVKWDAIENELESMEGRDAPLSPFLRSTADRLWPQADR